MQREPLRSIDCGRVRRMTEEDCPCGDATNHVDARQPAVRVHALAEHGSNRRWSWRQGATRSSRCERCRVQWVEPGRFGSIYLTFLPAGPAGERLVELDARAPRERGARPERGEPRRARPAHVRRRPSVDDSASPKGRRPEVRGRYRPSGPRRSASRVARCDFWWLASIAEREGSRIAGGARRKACRAIRRRMAGRAAAEAQIRTRAVAAAKDDAIGILE